jgi:hypothetical protein
MRGILIRFVSSLILVAGAIALTATNPSQNTAKADQTLTTTWQATQFINAAAPAQDDSKIGPVSIGVTKWHNTTYEGSTLVYEEDWSADVPATGTFKIRGLANKSPDQPPYLDLPSGFTQERLTSAWLFNGGAMHLNQNDDNRIIEFSFTSSPSVYVDQRTTGRAKFEALGNSIKCLGGGTTNARCLYATGSYGFGLYSSLGDGSGEQPDAFGAMIPTKWTVTGTLH